MKKFALAFGLLFFLTGCGQSKVVDNETDTSMPPSEGVIVTDEKVELPEGIIEKQIKDKVEAYWTDLRYPQWEDESLEVLNLAIIDLIQTEKEEFEKQEFFMDSEAFGNYYLGSTYEITSDTPDVISIRFDIATYSGGAHGMQYAKTINYNHERDEIFDMESLSEDIPNFLETISELCRAQMKEVLAEMSDDEWIDRGTEATLENFSAMTFIYDEALEFTFDPYQVAAYAAGPQVCYLTWDEIAQAQGLNEE